MLRLGLLVGLIAGGIAATLLKEPRNDDTLIEGSEPEGIVERLKYQLHQAQRAARDEKQKKEAAMLADFEQTRAAAHHDRTD